MPAFMRAGAVGSEHMTLDLDSGADVIGRDNVKDPSSSESDVVGWPTCHPTCRVGMSASQGRQLPAQEVVLARRPLNA